MHMRGTGGRLLYETLKNFGVDVLFGMEDPIHVFHAVDRKATRIVTIRGLGYKYAATR